MVGQQLPVTPIPHAVKENPASEKKRGGDACGRGLRVLGMGTCALAPNRSRPQMQQQPLNLFE